MSNVENLQIRLVRPNEQMESLKLLFSSLTPTQQLAEAQRLFQLGREGKVTLEGLLRAEVNGRLAGVIWAQTQVGRTAVVWLPCLTPNSVPGQSLAISRSLVVAADAFLADACLDERDVCIAQMLSPERNGADIDAFEACGYEYLAELEYMASMVGDCAEPPAESPLEPPTESPLEFEPYGEGNHERFVEALEQTYRETRDCPALNGVRRSEDVLAGYQATGSFAPERWFLLRYEGRDAGCLLLTDHPETDQYELVYMGLVPEARGNQLGQQVTLYAQWETRQAGRQRLVLAVDALNEPAKAMYAASGFFRWERRYVWVRRFDGKK